MNDPYQKAYYAVQKMVQNVLLPCIGEETFREGLIDTPKRFTQMMFEMTRGLREEPPKITLFDRRDHDQMITVMDLDYYSLCEHHLVPMFGKVHIGYLPDHKIAGLSKFGRVVDWISHKPQTQEYMTGQIATHLVEVIKPIGLIVVVEGTHLCFAMRGVKKSNHRIITSAIRGKIDKNEFMNILKSNRS